MKRTFVVTGLKPAFGKAVNDFVKLCDLGINGAFVKFGHIVTATVEDSATQEQLDRQPIAIKAAYEKLGCTDIDVAITKEE